MDRKCRNFTRFKGKQVECVCVCVRACAYVWSHRCIGSSPDWGYVMLLVLLFFLVAQQRLDAANIPTASKQFVFHGILMHRTRGLFAVAVPLPLLAACCYR